MLSDFSGSKVYLACGYTDLRRGIDGLATIIEQQFRLDPCSDALFLFCGRRTDRIKALYWEGDGDESAKSRYIRNRIFLRGEELKRKHPFVYRHKILLPFFDVYRLFRAAFTKPEKTWTELKRVRKFKSEK